MESKIHVKEKIGSSINGSGKTEFPFSFSH
jgi:hypothetical protein